MLDVNLLLWLILNEHNVLGTLLSSYMKYLLINHNQPMISSHF